MKRYFVLFLNITILAFAKNNIENMKFGEFMEKVGLKKPEEKEEQIFNQQYQTNNEALWGGGYRDDDDDEGGGGGGRYQPGKGRKKPGEKEEPPHKEFFTGDVLVLVDDKPSRKVPQDAWDFLMTFKEYTVRKVNEKGKIDIGCRISKNTPEGGVEKIYMFSPNRFDLKGGARPEGWVKPEPGIPEKDEDDNIIQTPGFAHEEGPVVGAKATAPGFTSKEGQEIVY